MDIPRAAPSFTGYTPIVASCFSSVSDSFTSFSKSILSGTYNCYLQEAESGSRYSANLGTERPEPPL